MGNPDNEEAMYAKFDVTPNTAETVSTPESAPAVELPKTDTESSPAVEIHKDEVLEEIREGTYNVGDVGEEEEESTEEVEDGRLLTGQKYEAPVDVDKFVDTAKGELVDKSKLTDWDVIKAVAKQNNIELRKPNNGCKRCYGRGYIGWDSVTKAPVPCSCIYPPKTPDQKMQEANIDKKNAPMVFNKKTYKQLKKLIKAEKKLVLKQKMAEEARLKQIEE